MTPEVREASRKRNALRKKVGSHREEWLLACKDAQEAIKKPREQSWRHLVSSATNDQEGRLWNVIKSLKGTSDTNSPNEAMVHKGRLRTSNKMNANTFASHYASVSKHNFTKEEHTQMKKELGCLNLRARSEYCQEFTLTEQRKALGKMKRKGTPGPDDIPPTHPAGVGAKGTERTAEYLQCLSAGGEMPPDVEKSNSDSPVEIRQTS